MPSPLIYSSSSIATGTRYTTGIPTDFVVVDVLKEMMITKPYQTPLLQWAFLNKNVKKHVTANVEALFMSPQLEHVPDHDYLVSIGSGGSATITFVPAQPNLFKVGTSIKFDDTNEAGWVSAVNGNDITATRDLSTANGAQTWSDTEPTSDTLIHILGEALSESSSIVEAIYTNPFMEKSRTQIFEKSIKMSDRMVAVVKNGGVYGNNWWDNNMQLRGEEMKIEQEKAFWMNDNHYAVTSSSGYRTKTQGLIYSILNRGGFRGTFSGGELDEQEFDNFLSLSSKGSSKKTLFCGTNIMNDIEKFMKKRLQTWQPVARYGVFAGDDVVNVFTYRKAQLVVEVIWCPLFIGRYSKKAVLLDDNYITLGAFADDDKGQRAMRMEVSVRPDGTPTKEALLMSDVGILLDSPACHGILEEAT